MENNNPTSEENKIFIGKFNPEKFGFFNLTPYANVNIGFNVRKKFNNKDDDNITLLGISIFDRIFNDTGNTRKPLNIHATYGKVAEGEGVIIRENYKFTEPIDLESHDEYYYDIVSNKFYKKNEKITANEILEEIYNKHIKPTRLVVGSIVRLKIFFWQILMKSIFEIITKIDYFVLLIISGNRFTYQPILEEEILNDKIIKSKYSDRKEMKIKEVLEEGKKFDFLAYKASRWSIIFYSLLHLLFYLIFTLKGYRPIILTTIFKNNFLTLIYVIFSLWIIEAVLPKILISLIRLFSKYSFYSLHKTIKL